MEKISHFPKVARHKQSIFIAAVSVVSIFIIFVFVVVSKSEDDLNKLSHSSMKDEEDNHPSNRDLLTSQESEDENQQPSTKKLKHRSGGNTNKEPPLKLEDRKGPLTTQKDQRGNRVIQNNNKGNSDPGENENGEDDTQETGNTVNLSRRPSLNPNQSLLDPKKPFLSMKGNFLKSAKAMFLKNPEKEKEALQKKFESLLTSFNNVPAGFADVDKPEVTKGITFEAYLKVYFESLLDETIGEYNKILEDYCKNDVAKFEELFKSWIAWNSWLKVDFSAKKTPAWVTYKKYSEAKKWCAIRNPKILTPEDSFASKLEDLQQTGKINITLPDDVVKITPQTIGDIITQLEENGDSEAVKAIKADFSKVIAFDMTKKEAFGKIAGTIEAKKVIAPALQAIKVDLERIGVPLETTAKLEEKFEKSNSIESVLEVLCNACSIVWDLKMVRELVNMQLKTLQKYYEGRNEDAIVINTFQKIVDAPEDLSRADLSKQFEVVNAWGDIYLNLKDIGVLETYNKLIKDYSFRVCTLGKFFVGDFFEEHMKKRM